MRNYAWLSPDSESSFARAWSDARARTSAAQPSAATAAQPRVQQVGTPPICMDSNLKKKCTKPTFQQFDKSRYGDLLAVLHTITTEELVMAVRRQSQVGVCCMGPRLLGQSAPLLCALEG
jgi:hypothetical protein